MFNSKIKIERVDVREDVVVVDHNSEMADYTNPTGAIYRRAFKVLAMTEDGRRRGRRKPPLFFSGIAM